jgi:GTPase
MPDIAEHHHHHFTTEMAPRCICSSPPLAPFLYPRSYSSRLSQTVRVSLNGFHTTFTRKAPPTVNDLPASRLNPAPDDYASPNFADKAELTIYAGKGGNGCVSFLREAYYPDGPPNGGDGGSGGNVYIQAAYGETSLHKLSRRRFVRAGRGRHGQGSAKSGSRGEDAIITVPVGTIVRELERDDPAAEEAMDIKAWRALQRQRRRDENIAKDERMRKAKLERALQQEQDADENLEEEEEQVEFETPYRRSQEKVMEVEEETEHEDAEIQDPERKKWLLYPGMSKTDVKNTVFPRLPRRDRYLRQPPAPIQLDLSRPTPQPILLATGGIGGLGNPHFTSREHPRPVFATRGDEAVTMKIELELKLLADVGLVGLPNAGKSTLLRALTNSRTRVGNWAFTTLQPNIGTVVLDKYSGRPTVAASRQRTYTIEGQGNVEVTEPRTRFTIADIPGLIEGAHLDRGLGIAFLRHVERAGVLAFVIDLNAGNAVRALDALWREVGLYAQMREEEEHDRRVSASIDWDLAAEDSRSGNVLNASTHFSGAEETPAIHIAGKPWFVVATKADLPETQDNFRELKSYLDKVNSGEAPHPSGVVDAWVNNVAAIPVSAINGQGVDRIVHWTAGLLDD